MVQVDYELRTVFTVALKVMCVVVVGWGGRIVRTRISSATQ